MSRHLGLCLVTGATGFVGRALIKALLAKGLRVRAMTRQYGDAVPGCETVFAELAIEPEAYVSILQGVETVFHVAGLAHARCAAAVYEHHSNATLALANCASSLGVNNFIYVSSTKAVADPGNKVSDENDQAWPLDAYGYWKRVTEQRLLKEIQIPHLSILRPCLIYGAGVKGNLQSMLKAIDRHYFPRLPEMGAERSMVSVTDVASALVLLAEHPEANRRVFIASDGQPYTAHRIYTAMRKALGYSRVTLSVPGVFLKAAGIIGDMVTLVWKTFPVNSAVISRLTGPAVFSAARLMALGWYPERTFEQELPLMVDTYRSERK